MDEEEKITNEFVIRGDDRHTNSSKMVEDLIDYFKLNNHSPSIALQTCLNALITIGRGIDMNKSDMLKVAEFLEESIKRNWEE